MSMENNPGNEKLLPVGEPIQPSPTPAMPSAPPLGTPSPAAQSWGAVISIIIIMLMIIIGAFYAWGKRIAQENALIAPQSEQ